MSITLMNDVKQSPTVANTNDVSRRTGTRARPEKPGRRPNSATTIAKATP